MLKEIKSHAAPPVLRRKYRGLYPPELAQNSLCYSASGLSMFQCVLGYQPPLFPWNVATTYSPAVDEWFRHSEKVWERVHRHLERVALDVKRVADQCRVPEHQFRPGDRVWLAMKHLKVCLAAKNYPRETSGPLKYCAR